MIAHVPDLDDFVQALKILLVENGVLTIEFPTAINLLKDCLFDTVYHEHFSYLTLTSLIKALSRNEMEVFHVEKLNTHGGSLRAYVQLLPGNFPIRTSVAKELQIEVQFYENQKFFIERLPQLLQDKKAQALNFINYNKQNGFRIAAYGAAAKGNTFLNYCGIDDTMIEYVVDNAPLKAGKFLPGSHIPIVTERELLENPPDFVILLAWNLYDEIYLRLSNLLQTNNKKIFLTSFQPNFYSCLIN